MVIAGGIVLASFPRRRDQDAVRGAVYATVFQTPELHGPPAYFTPDWNAAGQSVETLAALEPELVICAHGLAMRGADMRNALRALAENFEAIAVPLGRSRARG